MILPDSNSVSIMVENFDEKREAKEAKKTFWTGKSEEIDKIIGQKQSAEMFQLLLILESQPPKSIDSLITSSKC